MDDLRIFDEASLLGKISLSLGIASGVLVFGVGCCIVAVNGMVGFYIVLARPLVVLGYISAIVGALGFISGIGALFDRLHSKVAPVVGIFLSAIGAFLFVWLLVQTGK